MSGLSRRHWPGLLVLLMPAYLAACSNYQAGLSKTGEQTFASRLDKPSADASTVQRTTDTGPMTPSAAGNVTVQVVKYDELVNTLAQLKGKIVVVDFWATT